MKIWGEVPKVGGVYNNKKINKVLGPTKLSGGKDSITISTSAKDYQTAMKAIQEIPDIRQDKIKAVAERYSSGTYNVSGQDIADKVIKSVIDKRI